MTKKDEGGEALIHLRVPATTKARWVRQSRSEGKKLSDWIIEKIDKKGTAMDAKVFIVQTYNTQTRNPDEFTQVTADSALDAIEKVGEFKINGDYTSVRRLDYWQEQNPETPELSAGDNAHYQHNARGTAGIAAWRIK